MTVTTASGGHMPRSMLFAPASSERKLDKAFASAADAVIVDLEDAVAITEKPQARAIIAARLAQPLPRPVYVRVNGLATPYCWEDLQAVASPHLDGIVLPKAEQASDILTADWLLQQLERQRGIAPGQIGVIPIIETAKGIAGVAAVAAASPRVRQIAFGVVDLAADMGLDLADEDGAIQAARFAIAVASRAAGLPGPLDTAFVDIGDLERLRLSASRARAMGYTGKSCIHPAQIEVVNTVFSPTPAERERAQRIIDAFADAEANGRAAVAVDGVMIDYPVVAWARRILTQPAA
ncbi:HpcH/HpaI aldolase/citrate lyase family protein [Chelatococcus sp. GCM10030263]|uniref:HpcH/HpaI aldolase/citrate lyase family protein n=1 Tax=Chelatococcus sp. GCM10030263 TaxID=3273387 RepID=UPI0036235D47